MLLKELQIRGFKSFLNNTIMKFPKGITAIVGPNGSGKSNISDAIRWVLGESSVKSLRGNKMEDIIFTGTDSIKPVSFAEVSITFTDCKIKDLPYDEVVVTRRIFRDGNSEYLINKNKVRLKDVRELFMDTGIGRDGYSLIGQGQIDNVLSNKPEDRRDIFEEASGISLYKYKKDEALRKIERSNDDLDRLSDIFDEINKQYEYLKVESKKTEQYNEIYLEKNQLEMDLLYYNILKSIDDLKAIESEKESLESDLKNTKGNLDKAENEKVDLNNKTIEIEKEIDDMNNKKMIKYRNFSDIKSAYNILLERKKHTTDLVDSYNESIEKNNKEKLTLNEQIKEQREFLKNSTDGKDISYDEKIIALRDKLKISQDELDKIKEQETKNNLLKAQYEAETKLMDEKQKFYESEINNIQNELKSLEDISDIKNDELLKNKHELQKSIDELDKIKEEIETQKSQHQHLIDVNEDINEQLISLKSKKNNLLLNLNFNKNILDTNELFYQPVKFLEKNYSENDGYLGTVVSRINTENDYVKAIETALGSRLQFVFSKTVFDAKNMIAELNKKKAGRATFLPLDTTNSSNPQVMKNKPSGVMGFAIEFIKSEEPYKSIISYLLKDIVIVDNLDTGIKYQKQYKMIVTMNGEQLNQYGSITGGTSYKEKDTPLSIKAKITEISEEIKLIDSEMEIVNQKFESNKTYLENAETDLNLNNQKQIDLNSDLVILKSKISQLEKELDDLKTNYDKKLSDKNNIKAELESYEKHDGLKIVEIDTIKLNQLISEKKMLSEEIEKLEMLRQDSVDNILKRNNVEYKIESSLLKLDELEKINLELENKIVESKDLLKNIETDISNTLSKLSEAEELQKQDDEIIIALQNSKNDFRNKILEIDSLIRNLQDDINKIDNRINQQMLKEARLDESLQKSKIILEEKSIDFDEFISSIRDVKNLKYKRDRISEIDIAIEELGMVNLNAINEFKELSERKDFYEKQISDIQKAISDLNTIVANINRDMKSQFKDNMVKIRENFKEVFVKLFNGGEADLFLVDESDPLNSGINIVAKPPGKKLQALSLLSGGEKTLTAMALLFAILQLKPAPFCILDEIDAALDDVNISRYTKFLRELSRDSQFLIITHRKTTLEVADTIYGVCMRDKGVSEIISVRVEDYIEEVV